MRATLGTARSPLVWVGLLVLLLAAPLPAWADGTSHGRADRTLGRLRELYLNAVRDEGDIRIGLAEIEALRSELDVTDGSPMDAVLTAYRGALITLRAKHAVWPPARLRHLRDGLRILDGVVAARPEIAEVRYLRLMSCFYLPAILGRTGSVREDFAAPGRLLPRVRGQYPDDLYREITRFVLREGNLPGERRRALGDSLVWADE